jgi:hypothetical protein
MREDVLGRLCDRVLSVESVLSWRRNTLGLVSEELLGPREVLRVLEGLSFDPVEESPLSRRRYTVGFACSEEELGPRDVLRVRDVLSVISLFV